MKTIDAYNLDGKVAGKISLDFTDLEKVKNDIIHQAAITELSNLRTSTAHTKTRSEVRGGGKKPWKQKGTGRARAGSSRSPLWTGGGVTFGPRSERNYSKLMPRKMKKQAILKAINSHINNNSIIILNKLQDLKGINTNNAVDEIKKFPIKNNVLVILEKPFTNLILSLRNIPFIKTILIENINITDILKFDSVIISKDALEKITGKNIKISEKSAKTETKESK